MDDPVEFGKAMAQVVNKAVERIEKRIDALEARQPERGEKGDQGDQGEPGKDAEVVEVSDVIKELIASEGLSTLVNLHVAEAVEGTTDLDTLVKELTGLLDASA